MSAPVGRMQNERAPLTAGTWPSPLTATMVAEGGVALGSVAVTDGGRTVWWAESRPAEGGRTAVLRRTGTGPAEEVLPAGFDARTRVHEYGGRCWLPLGDRLVTSSLADQRLYLVDSAVAAPLTPDTGLADRYAEPTLLPGGTHVLCVRERVADPVTHALVVVPLDGSGEVVDLWTGSDFVGGAAVAPDGASLAFITWDHPRMPWDGTELRVAALLDGPALGLARVVLGGDEESVQAPDWEGTATLRAVTDRSGWWNLVRVAAEGGDPEPLWPLEQECGVPLWQLGFRTHVPLSGGRVAVVHGGRLAVLGPDGAGVDADVPFDSWGPWLDADGDVVVGLAWTPVRRPAVVAVDTATGEWREVAGPAQPDPAWAPRPERLQVPSAGGRTVHAAFYPPTSPVAQLPAGEAAPCVVFVHGGPTSSSPVRYWPDVAYFTSRGLAVVDVDYGGSTGYGRAYREALRGEWGVVDVEDCEAVARALTESGRASGVAIRGGSAGGWTVLAALTRGGSPFAAGASYYGVADLLALAADTHDFESRYFDSLVGPLPEARALYDARSPLSSVDRLDRPVLLLQGLDDPVVPPAQAEVFLAALRGKGVPHAYLAFEGEAHGFRRSETVVAALEAELSFYGQVFGFTPPDVPVLPLRTD
ncbi:MAG: S9 family peptidase [Mycobacteriales bacterium]